MYIHCFKTKLYIMIFLFLLIGQALTLENEKSPQSIPKIWNIRYDNMDFFGREEILKNLYLNFEKSASETKQIAIVGLPGTGKTQTAKQYARNFKGSYDIVWWFYPAENLESQLLNFAKELNLKYHQGNKDILISPGNTRETIDQIKDFLRITTQNWLLIFDDVQNASKIENLIPEHHANSRAHIIITSKNAKDWKSIESLDKFPRKTSLEMIQTISGDIDQESAYNLAETLGDYPILVSHAAHTIKSLSLNTEMLLKMLKTPNSNLDVIKLADQTLKYTLDDIQQTSNSAYQLLLFSTILFNENIPREVLEKWFIKNNLGSTHDFNVCLNILSKNFLIQKSSVLSVQAVGDCDLFNMHDIIRQVVLKRTAKKELKKNAKEAIAAIYDILNQKEKVAVLPEFSYIFPQIMHLSNLCSVENIDDEVLLKLQLEVLDHYQMKERNYIKMEEHAKLFSRSFDPSKTCKTEMCARFNTSLSGLKWWQGKHEEGIEHQLKAINYYTKHKPGSSEHIRSLTYLSSHYSFIGAIDEAEKTANEAKSLIKRIPKEEGIFYYFNSALLHQAFSTILGLKGDYKAAIQELNKSLEFIEQIKKQFNEPKKYLAMYLNFLIHKQEILYYSDKTKGELDNLLTLYQDSITALNSKQHRLSGILLALIGNSLYQQGRTTEALSYLKESLQVLNSWFGVGKHRLQAQAHTILGEIYANSNEPIKALNEYFMAEKIYKKAYKSLKVDEISRLYEKIVLSSLQIKDGLLVRRYANLHQTIFGNNHVRSVKLKAVLME